MIVGVYVYIIYIYTYFHHVPTIIETHYSHLNQLNGSKFTLICKYHLIIYTFRFLISNYLLLNLCAEDKKLESIDSDCTSFNEKPMRRLPVTANNKGAVMDNQLTRRKSIVKRLKSIGRQLRTGTRSKTDLKTLAII